LADEEYTVEELIGAALLNLDINEIVASGDRTFFHKMMATREAQIATLLEIIDNAFREGQAAAAETEYARGKAEATAELQGAGKEDYVNGYNEGLVFGRNEILAIFTGALGDLSEKLAPFKTLEAAPEVETATDETVTFA